MSKTMGQLLDEYLASELKPGQSVSSLYLYMADYQTPRIVLNTAEDSYDYTEILFTLTDLKQQASELAAEVKAKQDKIRQLEKSQRDIEKAIKLLKGDL